MGFYVLLICSILTLHNISANILTEPKDESYLEIIRKADEAEGINDRLNADPFDVQCPPVTPPENGQIVGQVSLEIGAIVHIKCNEGYHLIGEDTIQCQAIPNPFDPKALWFHRVGDISSTSPPQCKRQVSVKPTVISESVKGAVKNVEQDLNNLAVHDVNDVTAPPPLFNQGQAKTLKDDHAYFPPEELKNQIEVKPDCVLPYVVGPCRASKPRFYFNVRSGKCERFIYGGCQGNGNNYMTKEECEVNCVKSAVNSSNV